MRFPLLAVLILAASACELSVKVFTTSPVNAWAQFTFPNGTTGQAYHFNETIRSHNLVITGENCGAKPTILRTYKEPPNANVKNIGQTSALIDGGGHLEYQVKRSKVAIRLTTGLDDRCTKLTRYLIPSFLHESFDYPSDTGFALDRVNGDYSTRMTMRVLVTCGFGDCGRG